MSRRSKKRGRSSGLGWTGKVLIGLIIGGVILAAVVFLGIRSYLHSDSFREFLSAQVNRLAKVDGSFSPFRWQGLAVDVDAFDATGEDLVRKVRMDGLHTEIGVGGLGRGTWEVKGTNIRRIDVTLDARKDESAGDVSVPETSDREDDKAKSWLPTDVEIKSVDLNELIVRARLDQGEAVVSGMRIHSKPAGPKDSYLLETIGGVAKLPLPWIPEVRLDRSKLRWQKDQLFINSAKASVWENGRIDAGGEWDIRSGQYSIEGSASEIKCSEIFNEDWAKRFTGDVASDFTVENRSGSLTARGTIAIQNGTLTALPMLDTLAAYADTRRFRMLVLSDARSDWRWRDGELLFSNLVLASEGLVRLEGSITIRGREIDGQFRLGLAPGTLASIPGAETDVFSPGERSLLWAPLRVTGTLDDPEEDLSDRLKAAAGARMFDIIPETGEKVIKFTRSVLGESPANALDKGVKAVEEGVGIVREVGGVLDGFLGVGDGLIPGREEPRESEEEEK